ncbi:MAG: methionyl-tRNA formyltransferase [Gemmataceae bacterium]|nr:methionyl-tRNA formyltransferase [Gemmataceae bacterium]
MRLVIMGTGTFAEPTFEAILAGAHPVVGLVTQPDRHVGDKRGSTRQVGKGMKEIATERGIPIYQPDSINTPEGVQQLLTWQPDLLVVAAYGQILSRDVLAAAKSGGINVHASLLPKYRGAAPIAWAIYHGETETGVTIIRMSTALDAGNILAQEAVLIGPEETAGELEARLGPLGARLAVATIDRLAAGPVTGIPQDKSKATKAPKLTKDNGLIDWSRPAADVVNQIRAMQPWPTAYTFLHRAEKPPLRLIITKATLFGGRADDHDPGAVVFRPHGVLVTGGDHNLVDVTNLQPAGKKCMLASEFLLGHNLQDAWMGPDAAARDSASAKP